MGPQDFQGTASTFYAGEKEATKIARQAEQKKKKTALDNVDPYYSQLFEDLNANQGKAQGGLVSSMARRGLTRSGIRTNAESNLASEYGKLGQRLQTEKTAAKTNAQTEFDAADSLLNNVDLEYQGKINQMANELYNSWKSAQASKTNSGYQNTSDTGDELPGDALGYAQYLTSKGYSWGKAAKMVESRFGKIATGSAVDQHFWKAYGQKPAAPAPTGPRRESVPAYLATGKY